jgi:hypothetical protein
MIFTSMTMEAGAIVGFHAPYLEVPDGVYSRQQVEAAYVLAVRGINEFVKLLGELGIDADNTPDFLVPHWNQFHELKFAFDLNNLGVELQPRFTLRALTPSMVKYGCLNHNRKSRIPLRQWRAGTLRDWTAANDADMSLLKSFKGPSGKWIVVLPGEVTRHYPGRVWCFLEVFFDRAGIPNVSCTGFKWVTADKAGDVEIQRAAGALLGGQFDGLGEHDGCENIGQTSETSPRRLRPASRVRSDP